LGKNRQTTGYPVNRALSEKGHRKILRAYR
jgi:hypothetical protein